MFVAMKMTKDKKPYSPGYKELMNKAAFLAGAGTVFLILAFVFNNSGYLFTGSFFFCACWLIGTVALAINDVNDWHSTQHRWHDQTIDRLDRNIRDYLFAIAEEENKVYNLTQELNELKIAFENFKQGITAGKVDADAGTGTQD